MAGGSEPVQLIKMVENIQTRLDESDKKIELMATALQTLIKKAPTELGEKPHNGGGKDDKRKEEKRKRALIKPIHE